MEAVTTQRIPLTINTINRLTRGEMGAAIQKHLNDIAADLQDRPHVGKARVLTLKIKVTPVPDRVGNETVLDAANVQFELNPSIPSSESRLYPAMVNRGQLAFTSAEAEDEE